MSGSDSLSAKLADTVKKLAAVGAVVGVGYIGESGQDGGFIKDVWAALKTASPPVAMVMFILFLDERRERRECQRQLNERTVDFIQSTNAADAAFSRALDKIFGMTGRRRRTR